MYNVQEDKQANKAIVCNACGQPIKKVGNDRTEDHLYVEKKWNYFSGKDLTKHTFVVCEGCYDKWLQTFKQPVKEEDVTEVFDFSGI